jgi:preprotein translocase subunit SecD
MSAKTLLLLFAVVCSAVGCDNGRIHHRPGDPRSTLELRFATEDPNGKAFEKRGRARRLSLGNDILISSRDIRSISLHPKNAHSYCALDISFTDEAGARIHSATMNSSGRILAVLVDGQVVSAPTISGPLGPYVQLNSGDSCDDALQLARRIAP